MNSISIAGYVGQDVETHQAGDLLIAKCSVATYRMVKGEKVTDWHTVKCFGKTAQTLSTYVSKGSQIAVTGQLVFDRWNDKQSGKEMSRAVINADRLTLVGSKSDKKSNSNSAKSGDDLEEIPF